MEHRVHDVCGVNVVVFYCGDVENRVPALLKYLGEVYAFEKPMAHVEVFFFNSIRDMEKMLEERALSKGVLIAGYGMLSYHEAWDSIPRIYTATEVADKYGDALWRATLHHEAGHSILHGDLLYYFLPQIENEIPIEVLYMIFTGVKDFEVSNLLARIGLAKEQKPLAEHVVRETDRSDLISDIKIFLQLLPLAVADKELEALLDEFLDYWGLSFSSVRWLYHKLLRKRSLEEKVSTVLNFINENFGEDFTQLI